MSRQLKTIPKSIQSPQRRDLDFQSGILPGVSRTFALTIPVLPGQLADVVTNAYLLCRIADTIEDDTSLNDSQKTRFHNRFLSVIEGREDAEAFAAELAPLLSAGVLPYERDLVRSTARVVRVMQGFSRREREALARCLTIMCSGMPKFQRNRNLGGLRDLKELGAYCYVVAGVVGEMLTELFGVYCPDVAKNRREMRRLAVSFGQGLQMTNILKDIWEDRRAGRCWLPRSMFAGGSSSLQHLEEFHRTRAFRAGMNSLIGVTHRHLQNALEFSCLIPAREAGMRRFCLWALGLAVMTLQNLYRNPHFTSGNQVKVSRRTVRATHPCDQSHTFQQPLSAFALQVRRQRSSVVARRCGDLDAHGWAARQRGCCSRLGCLNEPRAKHRAP